jgi:hypothetical protein
MRTSEWLAHDPDSAGNRVGIGTTQAGGRLAAGLLTAPAGPPIQRLAAHTALLAGAATVAASGLIHLYLWADGYRNVANIGPLFLAQGLVGLILAVALVAYPRVLTAGLAAAYQVASVAALALSATRGFLGFKDTLDAPWATTALLVESAGALLLVLGGALTLRRQ